MIIDHSSPSSSLRVETLSFEEAADFNPQDQSLVGFMTIGDQDQDKA